MQWLSNKTEIERLSKFKIAYEFSDCERILKDSEGTLHEQEEEIRALRAEQERVREELQASVHKISTLSEQKEREMSGELKEVEGHVAEVSKGVVKLNTALTNQRESLASEQRRLAELQTSAREVRHD
jgi:structural maintenance of chromosome 2